MAAGMPRRQDDAFEVRRRNAALLASLSAIHALCQQTKERQQSARHLHTRLHQVYLRLSMASGRPAQQQHQPSRHGPAHTHTHTHASVLQNPRFAGKFAALLDAFQRVLKRHIRLHGNIVRRVLHHRAFSLQLRALHHQLSAMLTELSSLDALLAVDWRHGLDSATRQDESVLHTTLMTVLRSTSFLSKEYLSLSTRQQMEVLLDVRYELLQRSTLSPVVDDCLKTIYRRLVKLFGWDLHERWRRLPWWYTPFHVVEFSASRDLVTRDALPTYRAELALESPSGARRHVVAMRCLAQSPYEELHVEDAQRVLHDFMERMGNVDHPHVLPLRGANYVSGAPFVVRDFAVVGSLGRYLVHLAHSRRPRGGVDVDALRWRMLAHVCDGLLYLHEGKRVAHGGLKASNLLVNHHGRAVVADFGFRALRAKLHRRSREHDEYVRWLAPECCAAGAVDVTARWRAGGPRVTPAAVAADVYALGVTIVELVSRERPWASMDLSAVLELKRSASAEVAVVPARPESWTDDASWRLVQSMCLCDPGARPTLRSVHQQLLRLAEAQSVATPADSDLSELLRVSTIALAGDGRSNSDVETSGSVETQREDVDGEKEPEMEEETAGGAGEAEAEDREEKEAKDEQAAQVPRKSEADEESTAIQETSPSALAVAEAIMKEEEEAEAPTAEEKAVEKTPVEEQEQEQEQQQEPEETPSTEEKETAASAVVEVQHQELRQDQEEEHASQAAPVQEEFICDEERVVETVAPEEDASTSQVDTASADVDAAPAAAQDASAPPAAPARPATDECGEDDAVVMMEDESDDDSIVVMEEQEDEDYRESLSSYKTTVQPQDDEFVDATTFSGVNVEWTTKEPAPAATPAADKAAADKAAAAAKAAVLAGPNGAKPAPPSARDAIEAAAIAQQLEQVQSRRGLDRDYFVVPKSSKRRSTESLPMAPPLSDAYPMTVDLSVDYIVGDDSDADSLDDDTDDDDGDGDDDGRASRSVVIAVHTNTPIRLAIEALGRPMQLTAEDLLTHLHTLRAFAQAEASAIHDRDGVAVLQEIMRLGSNSEQFEPMWRLIMEIYRLLVSSKHAQPAIAEALVSHGLVSSIFEILPSLVNASDVDECVTLLLEMLGQTDLAKRDVGASPAYIDILENCPHVHHRSVQEIKSVIARYKQLEGNELLKEGFHTLAIQKFTEAIQLDRKRGIFYADRSLAYCHARRYDEAATDAERSVRYNPFDVQGYYRYGIAMKHMKRFKEAMAAFRKGRQVNPSYKPLETAIREVH
ncbi:hypothetical protein P43SY_009544 [Pythium insidiosum]|uniref:Protein kinase domain-containing protein n=1 Tax=Pythium insidiosum TaxID=114742 RepID=A0AAD5M3L9_PYTIN|nr:hypothetical protein P43SY_009544 [Pythium insidiosum]